MEVVCETMKLKPECVQEYIDLHDNTWPELITAIRQSGFLEEYIYLQENLVIVIMKCEDFPRTVKTLAATAIFQKWTKKVRAMLIDENEIIDLAPVWSLASFV